MKNIDEMEQLEDDVMSNFDHVIDEDVANQLRERPNEVLATYPAMNCCTYVWFNGEDFTAQIWTYRTPREETTGSLQDIMDYVCGEYGHE